MKNRITGTAVAAILLLLAFPATGQIVESVPRYVGLEQGQGVKVNVGPNFLIAVKTPKAVVIRYVPGEEADAGQWISEFREGDNNIVVLDEKASVPKDTKVYGFEKQDSVSLESAEWPTAVPTTVVTSGAAFHFNEPMVYNDKDKSLNVFNAGDDPVADLSSGLAPLPKFQGNVTCRKGGGVTITCVTGGGTIDLPSREQILFQNFLAHGVSFLPQDPHYVEEFDIFHVQAEFLAKQPEPEPEPDHGKSTAVTFP